MGDDAATKPNLTESAILAEAAHLSSYPVLVVSVDIGKLVS